MQERDRRRFGRRCANPGVPAIGINQGDAQIDKDANAAGQRGVDQVAGAFAANPVVFVPGSPTAELTARRDSSGQVRHGSGLADRLAERGATEQIGVSWLAAKRAERYRDFCGASEAAHSESSFDR